MLKEPQWQCDSAMQGQNESPRTEFLIHCFDRQVSKRSISSNRFKTIQAPKKKMNPSNTQTKMAPSVRLKTLFSIFIIRVFLFVFSFKVVSPSENTTDILNTSNTTDAYFDLLNTFSPEPTELNSTQTQTPTETQTPTASTAVEPVLTTAASVEPLPVSGRLPPPVTDSKISISDKDCMLRAKLSSSLWVRCLTPIIVVVVVVFGSWETRPLSPKERKTFSRSVACLCVRVCRCNLLLCVSSQCVSLWWRRPAVWHELLLRQTVWWAAGGAVHRLLSQDAQAGVPHNEKIIIYCCCIKTLQC